ncbi:MAG: hypothetical protein RMJ35_01255 [Phycisphaerales bacterium]|nr:hypothetical protein [Phycisphaerales bacterium]
MFLPVLLIRDYGLSGFLIFAIPNVVGAAAMGWVMRSPEQSRRFTQVHSVACGAFSLLTICFHGFFAGWMGSRLLQNPGLAAIAFGGLILVMTLLMRLGGGLERWLAAAVAATSGALFMLVLRYRLDLGILLPQGVVVTPSELAGLAAACMLGFLFCPYLDRTFHWARQSTTQTGARWAFGVGFGVVFLGMLCFSLIYADLILESRLNRTVLGMLLVHLWVQSSFTVAAHGALASTLGRVGWMYASAGVCLALGVIADQLLYNNCPGGELGYRLFLGFYGLIVPAYVLIGAASRTGGDKATWLLLLLVVAAALPFYWLAFIEGMMPWAGAGVAIVLLGGLTARIMPARREESIAASGA